MIRPTHAALAALGGVLPLTVYAVVSADDTGFVESLFGIFRSPEGKTFVGLLVVVLALLKWGDKIPSWIDHLLATRARQRTAERAEEEAEYQRMRELVEAAARDALAQLRDQNARQEAHLRHQDTRLSALDTDLDQCKLDHAKSLIESAQLRERDVWKTAEIERLNADVKIAYTERRSMLERIEGQSNMIGKISRRRDANPAG